MRPANPAIRPVVESGGFLSAWECLGGWFKAGLKTKDPPWRVFLLGLLVSNYWQGG
jgi:hypothetical protein